MSFIASAAFWLACLTLVCIEFVCQLGFLSRIRSTAIDDAAWLDDIYELMLHGHDFPFRNEKQKTNTLLFPVMEQESNFLSLLFMSAVCST